VHTLMFARVYARVHTHTHTHTECTSLINLLFTSLTLYWKTGQCCSVKHTYFHAKRENTVSHWPLKLKFALHAAETWHVQNCKLKFFNAIGLKLDQLLECQLNLS